MGLLSKLFGQHWRKSGSLTNGQVESAADLIFYEKIVDQIAVTDALKNDLKIALKQAFERPKSFYNDNNEFILVDRGLRYPKDASLTPKFVFIDILQSNGQMAEVGWREEESEIRIAVNEILKAKDYPFTIAYDDLYTGHGTDEIIRLIDKKELRPKGYALAILDIHSDSYVFTIVSLNEKEHVKEMFEALK